MIPAVEPLLFEQSSPGARATDLPGSDVPCALIDPAFAGGALPLPELGYLDLIRHYTRLSHKTFSVDANFYPLGSCTMKANPKINEWAAALPGFASLHPLQDDVDCQGALEMLFNLRQHLQEISGLHEVCLQPCAGAHGEWTSLKVIRAYFRDIGQPQRRIVLAPDTAHGTNPASCALCGASVVTIKSLPNGLTDLDDLKAHLTGEVAAIMVTNPNTVGKFDAHIAQMAKLVHDAGALLYLDGANMNAILGITRPGDFGADIMHFNTHKTFSTPHGCGGPGAGPIAVRKDLAPYLPVPQVQRDPDGRYRLDFAHLKSIGKVRSFWGQFGVLLRAYTYIRACGPDGLRNVSETAILSANYIAQRVKDVYALPFGPPRGEPMSADPCAHEFVTVPHSVLKTGTTIMDIAKTLIDRGIHPPTVHFPLHDCLMVEPTETESLATLDAFADALIAIAQQAQTDPAALKQAPRNASVRRLDEVTAARKPILTFSA